MSKFAKRGTRCDFCGKFSNNKLTGEYNRKDGSAGYIWPVLDENEQPTDKDKCDDCWDKEAQSEPLTA